MIHVTLKLCTIYNGVPYGPAMIHYTDQDNNWSFVGVGVFTDGKLHDGPFTCLEGDSFSRSYSLMKDGRPGEGEFGSYFNLQGCKEYVNSLTEESDVSGWQYYSGQFNKNE